MGMERMIRDRRGLEFKSSLFAIVAVSMLVIAFGVIISTQADFYSTDAVSEVGGYDKLTEISGEVGSYEDDLTPEDPEAGDDSEATTFRGVYGIITGIFGTFDIVLGSGGMIDSLRVQFGLSEYIVQGLFAIITIAIAFSLVAIIFRLSRRSA